MVVISSTFSPPATGIIFETPGTKLLINDQEIGTATLYITEHEVLWGGGLLPAGGPAPTIALSYPNISLHAVQRDPSPALYLVLNFDLRLSQLQPQAGGGDAAANVDDDDEEFDGDNAPITQLRFVPPNQSLLPAMYAAMNEGQALHPDPEDEDYMDGEDAEEEEGESDSFEDAEESAAPDDTAARLRALRLQAANGNPQLEDADDAIDD